MDPVALAEAGPWAVVVAMMVGIGYGAVRGWWVPGFVYRREISRAETLADDLDELTAATGKLAEAHAEEVRAHLAEVTRLATSIDRMTRSVGRMTRASRGA
jgi:hypothetical protein